MQLLDPHVGRPLHRGPLSIYPVWSGRAVSARGYLLAPGTVSVAERQGSAVVSQLVVTNPAQRPALVLDGDLLEGGRQHRVANRSVLVPAQQSYVLDVSCCEIGRWGGGSTHRSTSRRAPFEVRAALTRGQQEVWRRVETYSGRFGRNDTGSLLHAADQGRQGTDRLVAGVQPLPGQCGVIIGLAGQPLLLELSDSPRTFRALFGPLLQAVALDALAAEPVPTPGRRVRRFVDRLLAMPLIEAGEAGEGRAARGESAYGELRGLLWRERLVHASAINTRHSLVAA